MIYIFLFYISTLTFDAFIRFELAKFNISYLLYFRDLLIILSILYFFIKKLSKVGNNKLYYISFTIICIWTLIGIANTSIYQGLFGFKVFMPFLFGIIIADSFSKHIKLLNKSFYFLLFMSFVGIFLEQNGFAIWKGMQTILYNFYISSGRKWTTFGVERMSGFARTSFSAAIYIFFYTVFLIEFSKKRYLKNILYSLSLYFLILTTTKGIIIAFIIYGLVKLLPKVINKNKIFLLFTIILYILPIISFSTSYIIEKYFIKGEVSEVLFTSLSTRFSYIWEDAFNLLDNTVKMLFGRGIGGIGAAQLYFEYSKYSPADNLLLYIIVTFGLFSAFIPLLFIIKGSKINFKKSNFNSFLFYLLMGILLYGNVTNIIEAPILNLSLGMILFWISNRDQKSFPHPLKI